MKALRLAVAIALVAMGAAGAEVDRPLLDLVPTPAELGQGWITNQLLVLIDPLCKPSERVDSGNPRSSEVVSYFKQAMLISGSKAYLQIRCLHREPSRMDMYRIYLQRWPSAQTLARSVPLTPTFTNLPLPEFGQAAKWTDGPTFDRLSFRRDGYCAVIEWDAVANPQPARMFLPDWSQSGPTGITDPAYLAMRRIAQVLDAKLAGQTIPTNAPSSLGSTKNVPVPTVTPYDSNAEAKDLYLQYYCDAYLEALDGRMASCCLMMSIPYRNARIDGWYAGQRDGMLAFDKRTDGRRSGR